MSHVTHISHVMSLFSVLALSALLGYVVSLTILPPLQSPAAGLLPSPVASDNFMINTPFPANVSSGSNIILKIQCDGNTFGKNLNVASCRKIFNYVNKSDTEKIFADRHSGIPSNIELPWRIYDSM